MHDKNLPRQPEYTRPLVRAIQRHVMTTFEVDDLAGATVSVAVQYSNDGTPWTVRLPTGAVLSPDVLELLVSEIRTNQGRRL